MQLEGSCHCGSVRFRARSPHPHPFNLCYCSACRKTAGTGGFAINVSAESASLEVEGREHLETYRPGHVDEHDGKPSPQERLFCKRCGTALWVYDPRWPEYVFPHAGAVDTELPTPPERTHLMLDFKAPWVVVDAGPKDLRFPRYPSESIAEWHERLGVVSGDDGEV